MKNILVAVDFEEKDNVLVETAAMMAVKFAAKLWVVHISTLELDFIGYKAGPQYIRDVRAKELREEHRMLQKWSAEMNEKGIETDSLLIAGATVEMIISECKKLDIDLVVIGRHRHGVLHQVFVGGTDLEVARKSNIPVLIVPLD